MSVLMAALEAVLELDAWLRAWIATHHAPLLDEVMVAVTVAGGAGRIWLAAALVAAMLRPARAAAAWRLALAIGLTGLMTDRVIKPNVGRVRPFDAVADVRVIAVRPATYSFPSGHAANAFAGALALGRVVPAARPAWWLLAAAIGFSRVYVGVHYPLDVLGGAMLGLACAWFAIGGRAPAVRERDGPRPVI
jgi:undecaprenyl-diphosphatase